MSISPAANRAEVQARFETSNRPAKEQKYTKEIPDNVESIQSCYVESTTRFSPNLDHSKNSVALDFDPTSAKIANAPEPAVSKSLQNRTSTNFLSTFIQKIKNFFLQFFSKPSTTNEKIISHSSPIKEIECKVKNSAKTKTNMSMNIKTNGEIIKLSISYPLCVAKIEFKNKSNPNDTSFFNKKIKSENIVDLITNTIINEKVAFTINIESPKKNSTSKGTTDSNSITNKNEDKNENALSYTNIGKTIGDDSLYADVTQNDYQNDFAQLAKINNEQ